MRLWVAARLRALATWIEPSPFRPWVPPRTFDFRSVKRSRWWADAPVPAGVLREWTGPGAGIYGADSAVYGGPI